MDGAMETSMSFTSVFSEDLRLSTSISTLKSSDTLNNSAPLYTANHLDVDVELTTLWLTLEYYPPQFHGKRAKLWYGAGVHAGVVELGYRERLYVPNAGYFRENRVVKSAPLAGAHAAAGICIYPHEQSALCLNIEGRINFTATGSDFDGSLISPAILVGLRWDFGLNAD
jgi:hypothetical protein